MMRIVFGDTYYKRFLADHYAKSSFAESESRKAAAIADRGLASEH